jgi:hypothetical protein
MSIMDASGKGVSRVKNARDMEERCRILKQLGATFYVEQKDCKNSDL